VSRRKREHVEGAGEDADTLDAGVGVDEPVVVDADANAEAPAFVWRDRGGKRDTGAWFAMLACCSNARAKLMAD
jgi:hypothetical protein